MLIKLLRRYLKPYKGAIGLVLLCQTIQAIASLYLPTLNANIIDEGVAVGDTGYIWRTGGVMLAVSFGQILTSLGAVYLGARTAMSVGRDVRAGLFSQVQTFSAREVAKFGAPSLITRTTNDVQQVQMIVLMTFVIIISAPIVMVGGVVMALRHDVKLSGLLLIIIPILAVFLAIMMRLMAPKFQLMQTTIDKVNRVLREQITGIRVIRAFVRDQSERERFDGVNHELTKLQLSIGYIFSLFFPAIMLIMNLTSVAVIWFGGKRIESGGMEIGSLTAFITYLMQILMSVLMAAMMFFFVPRAEVCAKRIVEVLDTQTSVEEVPDAAQVLPQPGHLEMRGAAFRYPGAEHPVLQDITFEAPAGKTTAIIGATGSGKTTLVNLIPRLFDATSGSVVVGGVDAKQAALQTLWASMGVVPQKPYLFSGTVASNVRYGKPDATDEEIWAALEVAEAAEFVREHEDGLEMEIAQGGTNVSGGQRQRLAIARAVVRRPDLYVFDDSFSALDFATDARVRANLKRATGGATVVIVAQRVGTIMEADQILVLDQGRIVGRGTHRELLESNDTYREIVESQMSLEEAA
ncbi:MAG: ABC transporter ATP-binding protein/permease [Bifidobacteriaceae bacterium]|jgi:ATP-binding cassette subfamily B protein|nr:ABC transporter ATP-binding protein/permease [Bifidobacteriaceae bacterium]